MLSKKAIDYLSRRDTGNKEKYIREKVYNMCVREVYNLNYHCKSCTSSQNIHMKGSIA